jgi:hypothetical protein
MIPTRLCAASAVLLVVTSSVGSAQNPPPDGRLYAFHSPARGGCPSLDWHIVANGTDLNGMISWNNMKDMARATGTLNPTAKTFQMTAVEQGGQGRTATITGSVEGNGYLNANISGPDVKCTRLSVPWFAPYQGAG